MTNGTWTRSVFDVPKMDCVAEERLVRMAIDGDDRVGELQFDLQARSVAIVHRGSPEAIAARLAPLGLGARLASSAPAGGPPAAQVADTQEARTLWMLLAINAVMFAIEIIAGWLAQSTGLIADSLDMFADAAVYGVSLYAVGKAASAKLSAARLAGWLQLLLALGAFSEVVRRLIVGSAPEPGFMISVAFLALAANVACLALISRHRSGGVHMRASWIFSTNDVIANLGVIVAGMLVGWTGSNYPDLIVGALIGLVVLSGAVRILRLKARSP